MAGLGGEHLVVNVWLSNAAVLSSRGSTGGLSEQQQAKVRRRRNYMRSNRTAAGREKQSVGLAPYDCRSHLGAAAYSCRGMLQLQANAPPDTHSLLSTAHLGPSRTVADVSEHARPASSRWLSQVVQAGLLPASLHLAVRCFRPVAARNTPSAEPRCLACDTPLANEPGSRSRQMLSIIFA